MVFNEIEQFSENVKIFGKNSSTDIHECGDRHSQSVGGNLGKFILIWLSAPTNRLHDIFFIKWFYYKIFSS